MTININKTIKKVTAFFVLAVFIPFTIIPPQNVSAQSVYDLPVTNELLPLSPQYNSAIMEGIKVYPDEPFKFDFIVDTADSQFTDSELKVESNKLIKYFLTSLTTPDKDLWVNLSPYEKNRIIPEGLGNTEMGRDLLSEDYILKQITASLIYPENKLGSDFWERVYAKAKKLYGTTDIPVNTFNKVWIVPDKAVVYEDNGTAFITEAHLKVMMEQDYLALQKNMGDGTAPDEAYDKGDVKKVNKFASDIVKDLVLPELEKEVNGGKNFAELRQIYYSMILASWFKRTFKRSLLGKVYAGQNLTDGVDIQDKTEKQKIYEKYLEAFKEGVFNYVKEDFDVVSDQIIPRKYFSGGNNYAMLTDKVLKIIKGKVPFLEAKSNGRRVVVKGGVDPINNNGVAVRLSRRSFLLGSAGAVALSLFNPKVLLSQVLKSLEQSDVQAYFKFFSNHSNPETGISISHFGDANESKINGAQTYDLSLRAIGEAGQAGLKILNVFARNNVAASGETNPQTYDIGYAPSGGVLNNIRVKNFSEPQWWKRWEFKISAGDNAWIGMAALQNYSKTMDRKLLRFAEERADFLESLQDEDGGIRFGPKGQYHINGPLFFWNIKSTEGNESALYFFDMLFEVTKENKYKAIADGIYGWLVDKMYDHNEHLFMRGEGYANGVWEREGLTVFAPDTTSWAPLERMLKDNRFGATRAERLQEFERSIKRTEDLVGVYQGKVLKGISFSLANKTSQIISIEWSSSFALRYWRMAQEYAFLAKNTTEKKQVNEFSEKAQVYRGKYNSLIKQLGEYFNERDGARVAPYAVFTNGEVAANIPTGHGWDTPSGYASVSNVYYGFAAAKFDPMILDKAMLVSAVPSLADTDAFAPNLTEGTLIISSITIQGKEGPKEMALRFPDNYQYDGRAIKLEAGPIKSVISEAIAGLQSEFPQFDISGIKGIDVADINNGQTIKRVDIMEIPVQAVAEVSDLTGESDIIRDTAINNVREEILKLAVFHEEGESHDLGPEQLGERDLRYLEDLEPVNVQIPEYKNVSPANYQIIMPVYNEGELLDFILNKIKAGGYLDKVVIVNDASTDNSGEILSRWEQKEGLKVVHLKENMKKEGAIREVMERLNAENKLAEKTILLDSDTFFDMPGDGGAFDEKVAQVSAYMNDKDVAGISFRIDAYLPDKPSILQKAQYAEYASIRFWNKISSKKNKLWVINGPAGIFRSDVLLDTMRNMVPDFETGDLLITVNLMKKGYKVGYYPKMKTFTVVPNTKKELFKQRRRWERGTNKVIVNEKGFYIKQVKDLNALSAQMFLNYWVYIGLAAGALKYAVAGNMTAGIVAFINTFLLNYVFWTGTNSVLTLTEKNVRKEKEKFKIFRWFLLEGLVYPAVILPARFTGMYDAVAYFLSGKKTSRDPLADTESKKSHSVVTPAATVGPAVDQAQAAREAIENPGGIDLNPGLLDLKTKGQKTDINGPINFDMIRKMGIKGFNPVIFQIIPFDASAILAK